MAVGLGALLTAGALGAGPATATDGSLYAFGVESMVAQAAPDGQCYVQQTGASLGVICPPQTSQIGTKWQIDLRTPLPGTVIEAFRWSAVRFHQTATSIAQQVLADGNLAWQGPEADIPVSPATGSYELGMRAFTASLRLYQTQARQQPNRVWTFLYPTIVVRDLEAPSARWTSVPSGWITGDQAQVGWQASDNVDSDGIGQQRIRAAGRTLYAGSPGQGAHVALLNLAGLPDGVQTLRLEVDGDGTGGAPAQEAPLRLDRTPPSASIGVVGLQAGRVRVTANVADPTSGVRDWTLRARGPDGPTVASWSSGDPTRDLDLAAYAAPGETIRFSLAASDNAGLSREVTSALVTRPSGAEARTVVIGGTAGATRNRIPLLRLNDRRLRPRAGRVIPTLRPLLRWTKGPRGTRLYNIQIFKLVRGPGGQFTSVSEVLSAFPRSRYLRVPRKTLEPRTCYAWRVWPWRGKRFTGKPLGVSNFCVASARVLKAAEGTRALTPPGSVAAPRGNPPAHGPYRPDRPAAPAGPPGTPIPSRPGAPSAGLRRSSPGRLRYPVVIAWIAIAALATVYLPTLGARRGRPRHPRPRRRAGAARGGALGRAVRLPAHLPHAGGAARPGGPRRPADRAALVQRVVDVNRGA